jgi:heat-inducible transcriptional repressor
VQRPVENAGPAVTSSAVPSIELSDRQAAVLTALVTAYIHEGGAVGSVTLSHVLAVKLSSASVRNVLAELSELGLVVQPHTSSGRVPTELGLRHFVDDLLDAGDVAAYDRREIAFSVDEAGIDRVVRVASQLLSDRTRLLGFVVAPRIDRLVLRHVSLVRLGAERILVVLVSADGSAHRCVIDEDCDLDQSDLDQSDLDRIASLLNARVHGRSLREVREQLAREARDLAREARGLQGRAIEIGRRAIDVAVESSSDVVIASRLALLDQPEFQDPERIRELFSALETNERLLQVLDQMIDGGGVSVAFGGEMDDPALHRCAVIAAGYGAGDRSVGSLGVIGPPRMDFGRIIPLVGYISDVITEKLVS